MRFSGGGYRLLRSTRARLSITDCSSCAASASKDSDSPVARTLAAQGSTDFLVPVQEALAQELQEPAVLLVAAVGLRICWRRGQPAASHAQSVVVYLFGCGRGSLHRVPLGPQGIHDVQAPQAPRLPPLEKADILGIVWRVLITGGAGFIRSHLDGRLIAKGQAVSGIDDLSTGAIENPAAVNKHPLFT